MPAIAILGTRGIPASHGGFETFAERLALHLAARNWDVTVTCQAPGRRARTAPWNGITLRHLPEWFHGPLGTIVYDLLSVLDTAGRGRLVLTLGYNTAAFGIIQRIGGTAVAINMDGLEWRRPKWPLLVRAWFYLNAQLAPRLAQHVIADHPVMAERLRGWAPAARISMIPYGADTIESADAAQLAPFGLTPDHYALMVARPEPDNSVLEIVTAFSRERRGAKLCVLGSFDPRHKYHRTVLDAASDEVMFVGPCYDPDRLAALRFHARIYVHGHRFGGTNPSLVEALGAGCAVLAHDNPFNRWVAGDAMRGFRGVDDCAAALGELLAPAADVAAMRAAARGRHRDVFMWPVVLREYEILLERLWQSGVNHRRRRSQNELGMSASGVNCVGHSARIRSGNVSKT